VLGMDTLFSTLPAYTVAFVVFIVLVTLAFHVTFSEKAVDTGPTILTTTGIFATFLGIAIGLSKFDVSDLQASVPALLDGLKTAFWASVAGVGGALTLKYRLYVFGIADSHHGVGTTDASVETIVEELRAVRWSLVGTEDGTLVSQIKLMRQDTIDRLDALKKAQMTLSLCFLKWGQKRWWKLSET